jgi:hypothetical protein
MGGAARGQGHRNGSIGMAALFSIYLGVDAKKDYVD